MPAIRRLVYRSVSVVWIALVGCGGIAEWGSGPYDGGSGSSSASSEGRSGVPWEAKPPDRTDKQPSPEINPREDPAVPEAPVTIDVSPAVSCGEFSRIWSDSTCEACLNSAGVECQPFWIWVNDNCPVSYSCVDSKCIDCGGKGCPDDTCQCINSCLPSTQNDCTRAWGKLTDCYTSRCTSVCN